MKNLLVLTSIVLMSCASTDDNPLFSKEYCEIYSQGYEKAAESLKTKNFATVSYEISKRKSAPENQSKIQQYILEIENVAANDAWLKTRDVSLRRKFKSKALDYCIE